MHTSLEQFNLIKDKVNDIVNKKQLKIIPKIIVVTKTFPLSKIMLLLKNGLIVYGMLLSMKLMDFILNLLGLLQISLITHNLMVLMMIFHVAIGMLLA